MSDTLVQALFYGLVLVLPLSALVARHVRVTVLIGYAVVWTVIFGLALVLAGYIFT